MKRKMLVLLVALLLIFSSNASGVTINFDDMTGMPSPYNGMQVAPEYVEEGRLANEIIPSEGKKTWRPSWIKGTLAAPAYFEGSAAILSSVYIVGQTNTIYPGVNQYGTDAFDLIESAMPASTLFFPKAFDNLLGTGATHLTDNFIYVQNPQRAAKNIQIELFKNVGSSNGSVTLTLAPNVTRSFRPRYLVTDGTGTSRGSLRGTAVGGGEISGAIKYEIHKTTLATSAIIAMTIVTVQQCRRCAKETFPLYIG